MRTQNRTATKSPVLRQGFLHLADTFYARLFHQYLSRPIQRANGARSSPAFR
jgi:hypothetical protein